MTTEKPSGMAAVKDEVSAILRSLRRVNPENLPLPEFDLVTLKNKVDNLCKSTLLPQIHDSRFESGVFRELSELVKAAGGGLHERATRRSIIKELTSTLLAASEFLKSDVEGRKQRQELSAKVNGLNLFVEEIKRCKQERDGVSCGKWIKRGNMAKHKKVLCDMRPQKVPDAGEAPNLIAGPDVKENAPEGQRAISLEEVVARLAEAENNIRILQELVANLGGSHRNRDDETEKQERKEPSHVSESLCSSGIGVDPFHDEQNTAKFPSDRDLFTDADEFNITVTDSAEKASLSLSKKSGAAASKRFGSDRPASLSLSKEKSKKSDTSGPAASKKSDTSGGSLSLSKERFDASDAAASKKFGSDRSASLSLSKKSDTSGPAAIKKKSGGSLSLSKENQGKFRPLPGLAVEKLTAASDPSEKMFQQLSREMDLKNSSNIGIKKRQMETKSSDNGQKKRKIAKARSISSGGSSFSLVETLSGITRSHKFDKKDYVLEEVERNKQLNKE